MKNVNVFVQVIFLSIITIGLNGILVAQSSNLPTPNLENGLRLTKHTKPFEISFSESHFTFSTLVRSSDVDYQQNSELVMFNDNYYVPQKVDSNSDNQNHQYQHRSFKSPNTADYSGLVRLGFELLDGAIKK